MTSSRLPGKALASLCGEPMVWRQIERIRHAQSVAKLVVATSAEESDDPLAAHLVARGQTVFRGAAANLAERFMRCVEAAGPVSHVLRLKGDSPFVDPRLIDAAAGLAADTGADYVSNRAPASYPRGLEVEIATVDALAAAAQAMQAEADQVSPMRWLRTRPDQFSQANLQRARDLSALDWRVKTPPDLEFARGVYGALHAADPKFSLEDVLDVLQGRQDLARYAAA